MKCKNCSYFAKYAKLTMNEWRECVSCGLDGTKKNIDEKIKIYSSNDVKVVK